MDNFAQHIAETIPIDLVDEIVNEAVGTGLHGEEMRASLVRSGAALGIDQAMDHILMRTHGVVNLQVKLARKLTGLMQKAMGEDDTFTLLRNTRDAIVVEINDHIEQVTNAAAHRAEMDLGLPASACLSKDRSDEFIATVPASMAFQCETAFHGFILSGGSAGCGCPNCMAEVATSSSVPRAGTLKMAAEKYGSLDRAFAAFNGFYLRRHWGEIDKMAAYYKVDGTSTDEAEQIAAAAFTKMFGRARGHE